MRTRGSACDNNPASYGTLPIWLQRSTCAGFKNSFKGIGYFLGAAMVAWSYNGALSVLMCMILLAMPWAVWGLSKQLGRTAKSNATLKAIFRMNYNINWLSAARLFLFGSR